MGLLVDHEIKKEIKIGLIQIDPYNEELVGPASLDIRLGNTIGFLRLAPGFDAIDPEDKTSFFVEEVPLTEYILKPGEFILAEMLEKIKLPSDTKAQVFGRSSLGRLGFINSSHAGLIDLGFGYKVTLELFNSGPLPIKLRPNMAIGQLEFTRTEELPEQDYQQRKSSRYFGQAPLQQSKGI